MRTGGCCTDSGFGGPDGFGGSGEGGGAGARVSGRAQPGELSVQQGCLLTAVDAVWCVLLNDGMMWVTPEQHLLSLYCCCWWW